MASSSSTSDETPHRRRDDSSPEFQTAPAVPEPGPGKEAANSRPPSNKAPPDGGLLAWLQVAGSWVLFFNTFGLINTFGVYQTYYESGQLFRSTSSNISWIGSIQAYIIFFVGTLTGPLFDLGHFRVLLVVGSFLVVFGHMMLSLCHEYWQVLLAQGFTIGLGSGLLFIPSLAIMPSYFSRNVGFAIGIAVSGSSVGGIIYPIVFYRLIKEIGFGWSVRVLGFIAMAMLCLPLACMRMRVQPAAKRKLVDWSAFTDAVFISFVLSCTVGFVCMYCFIFYVSYYSESSGALSAEMAFYLIAILNVGSLIGRTLPNYLGDKIGFFNIMGPCTIVVAVLTLLLITVRSYGGIIAIAFLFGIFSGVFFSMPGPIFVRITKDKAKIGTRMGMGFAIIGLGALAGGPGGGGVLGTISGTAGGSLRWTSLWIYGGVTAMVSGVALIALRFYMAGAKLLVKV